LRRRIIKIESCRERRKKEGTWKKQKENRLEVLGEEGGIRIGKWRNCKENAVCEQGRRTSSENVFLVIDALFFFLFRLFIVIGGVVSELSRWV